MFTLPWGEKYANGEISCSNDVFGDVARNKVKQCYCEAEVPPRTVKCGTEGGDCVCTGTVYYGVEKVG
jgi:hypothetical protein